MFRSRILNLILSVVAAVVIWAFVVLFINPTMSASIRSVPVELINLDALAQSGLAVSTAQSYTVDVVVEGPRSDVGKIEVNDIKATADMKGFAKGMNSVSVSASVPNGITKLEIRPERIDVNIEERVSVMKPIRLEYTEKFPSGTEPGFISLSPQEIEASGTKAQVDSVAYIRALIDNSTVSRENNIITVDAVPLNRAGNPINDLTLSQDSISISIQLCDVKEVPFRIKTVGEPAEGKAMSQLNVPSTVFVRGDTAKIKGLTEVSGKDINIEGLNETTIFTPELNLPQGVELASESQNLRATVEIEGIVAKSFEYTAEQIEVTGTAISYTAHVNTAGIVVTVYGTKDQIERFDSAELKPYVDLTGYDYKETGADFEVLFQTNQKYYKIESDPKNVRVFINKESRVLLGAATGT